MSEDDFDGLDGTGADPRTSFGQMDGVEFLLLDSLIHHLIEKGVLTKNDALSVIQTVAHVVRGNLSDDETVAEARATLSKLERIYLSFQAMAERGAGALDGENVHLLRPPLHGDRPEFPGDD